ncbi:MULTISPECIES: DUF402 domain-containing protein [Heyndrickxia]|uniref:DUF402 domain-containing protein n=1 Tax=Heyndrickxia TaxID=2837504 RepID=UPI0006EC2A85|nr:DUF402 domain-containing protein [Heyndrickxia shackletonii]MBB2480018.1 DUF402 domain-containing protein [Bacillus sp. APMAM]NEZ00791.1 DUF402 domain-containing protein [Heyndrickxia shackletonii]
MEKKYADRLHWKRVTERNFQIQRVQQGTVTCLSIHKVREPLLVTYEKLHCIADNEYKWFQVFQEDLSYTLTIVENNSEEIVQYYYDLCLDQGFDKERNSPWFLDAYLDVVYLPSGEIFILDEDELQEALLKERITQEQVLKVQDVTNQIINSLKSRNEPLMKIYEKSRSTVCAK